MLNVHVCDNDETCKLLVVNPAHAYHVTGMIDGINIRFMLDTGAAVIVSFWPMYERKSRGRRKHHQIAGDCLHHNHLGWTRR